MRSLSVVLFIALFLVAGCGTIEDMIEGATARTIQVEQSIHNTTSERGAKSATVVEDLLLTNGQSRNLGPVSVSELADAIDVATLQIGATRFWMELDMRNRGNTAASVTLTLVSGGDGEVIDVLTLPLSAGQNASVGAPTELTAASEAMHKRLLAVFDGVGEQYLVTPIVTVQGGDANGVYIDRVELCALPTYLRSELLSPDELSAYSRHIEGVHDAKLSGTMTNEGAAVAEVRFYLSGLEGLDPASDLIAQAYLSPGETIEGADLLLDGGEGRIEQAMEDVIDGDEKIYDFTIVSAAPIKVRSDDLRIEIAVDVEADIF